MNNKKEKKRLEKKEREVYKSMPVSKFHLKIYHPNIHLNKHVTSSFEDLMISSHVYR